MSSIYVPHKHHHHASALHLGDPLVWMEHHAVAMVFAGCAAFWAVVVTALYFAL